MCIRDSTKTDQSQDTPSIASLANGGFVVTWESWKQDGDSDGVYGQIYDKYGLTGSNNEFRVNTYTSSYQENPFVTGLNDGGFVVIWEGKGSTDSSGVFGQVYKSSGATSGDEFRVNTYTSGYQGAPSVTGLNDGGLSLIHI